MKNFHIAIAIPTFNRLNHLKKAINSIITQKKDKNTRISIIISNIASVDGTHEYLDDIKKTEGFYIFNKKSEVKNSYMTNIYHLSQTIPNEVDWVWLMGYKRGGCAKEMKRAELALNEERRHRVVCFHCYKSPEQEAKSQQIVGQSLLSCLQYPVPYLSRLQRIYPSQHSKLRWSMMLGRSLS